MFLLQVLKNKSEDKNKYSKSSYTHFSVLALFVERKLRLCCIYFCFLSYFAPPLKYFLKFCLHRFIFWSKCSLSSYKAKNVNGDNQISCLVLFAFSCNIHKGNANTSTSTSQMRSPLEVNPLNSFFSFIRA